MEPAAQLCIVAAGVFFLNGLLTGVWKYLQIMASPTATAHPYVDIAHRASLLYSFAALLLMRFAELSALSVPVEVAAAAAPLLFFAIAIGTYMLHAIARDTDNQFRTPHRLGPYTVSPLVLAGSMWALIIAEIGGFLVLFIGALQAMWS